MFGAHKLENIENLLLDLDGLLWFPHELLHDLAKPLVQSMKDAGLRYEGSIDELAQKYIQITNNNPYHPLPLALLADEFGQGLDKTSRERIITAGSEVREYYQNKNMPRPDRCDETLLELKSKHNILIASNGIWEKQKKKIIDLGFCELLGKEPEELIITQSEPHLVKPHAKFYQKAMGKLAHISGEKVNIDNTAYVGDKWLEDVIGPMLYGLLPIKVHQGKHASVSYEETTKRRHTTIDSWIKYVGMKTHRFYELNEFKELPTLLKGEIIALGEPRNLRHLKYASQQLNM